MSKYRDHVQLMDAVYSQKPGIKSHRKKNDQGKSNRNHEYNNQFEDLNSPIQFENFTDSQKELFMQTGDYSQIQAQQQQYIQLQQMQQQQQMQLQERQQITKLPRDLKNNRANQFQHQQENIQRFDIDLNTENIMLPSIKENNQSRGTQNSQNNSSNYSYKQSKNLRQLIIERDAGQVNNIKLGGHRAVINQKRHKYHKSSYAYDDQSQNPKFKKAQWSPRSTQNKVFFEQQQEAMQQILQQQNEIPHNQFKPDPYFSPIKSKRTQNLSQSFNFDNQKQFQKSDMESFTQLSQNQQPAGFFIVADPQSGFTKRQNSIILEQQKRQRQILTKNTGYGTAFEQRQKEYCSDLYQSFKTQTSPTDQYLANQINQTMNTTINQSSQNSKTNLTSLRQTFNNSKNFNNPKKSYYSHHQSHNHHHQLAQTTQNTPQKTGLVNLKHQQQPLQLQPKQNVNRNASKQFQTDKIQDKKAKKEYIDYIDKLRNENMTQVNLPSSTTIDKPQLLRNKQMSPTQSNKKEQNEEPKKKVNININSSRLMKNELNLKDQKKQLKQTFGLDIEQSSPKDDKKRSKSPKNRYKFFKSSDKDKFFPYDQEQSIVPKPKFIGRVSSRLKQLYEKKDDQDRSMLSRGKVLAKSSRKLIDESRLSPKQLKKYKQDQAMDRLAFPDKPCRSSCSTVHNHKWQERSLQHKRTYSTIKIALKPIQVERPRSAETTLKDKQKYMLSIDWEKSELFKNIQEGKEDSNNNHDLDIYKEIEVNYMQSILKKKKHDNDILPPEEVQKIFEKAMRTLKYYMDELMLTKSYEVIESQYQTQEIKQSIDNCIKVLLRCKKIFEVRSDIIRILKSIGRRDKIKSQIKRLISDVDQVKSQYENLIIISSRMYSDIKMIQTEHRNFRRPFIFNMQEQTDYLKKDCHYVKKTIEECHEIELKLYLNDEGRMQNIDDLLLQQEE
ncbi:UNKNOWN [Stylonychia lemnae]|uniref:Uncharacterized protein n=1 Tax=Stylonychia lemnae TaxID=5949 RepID=A0A078ATU1_STYLE|nr:UNKNOWN [Stylonychia lemnae]|eukprot:CDW84652.1 UNKNOWN [Stylonychia lemnae]